MSPSCSICIIHEKCFDCTCNSEYSDHSLRFIPDLQLHLEVDHSVDALQSHCFVSIKFAADMLFRMFMNYMFFHVTRPKFLLTVLASLADTSVCISLVSELLAAFLAFIFLFMWYIRGAHAGHTFLVCIFSLLCLSSVFAWINAVNYLHVAKEYPLAVIRLCFSMLCAYSPQVKHFLHLHFSLFELFVCKWSHCLRQRHPPCLLIMWICKFLNIVLHILQKRKCLYFMAWRFPQWSWPHFLQEVFFFLAMISAQSALFHNETMFVVTLLAITECQINWKRLKEANIEDTSSFLPFHKNVYVADALELRSETTY